MRLRRLASSSLCDSDRGRRDEDTACNRGRGARRHTAAPASPTTSAPPTMVELQPGPHSAIADVDLPEGTVQCTTNGCVGDPHTEHWFYSAPYDDVVAFLRKQFATGRRYDTHGATWDRLASVLRQRAPEPAGGTYLRRWYQVDGVEVVRCRQDACCRRERMAGASGHPRGF